MGIFGWSYPAGCNGPPDDAGGPCEICGEEPGNCECPECPVCGTVGDPRCEESHGLTIPPEQKERGERNRARWEEQADHDFQIGWDRAAGREPGDER